MSTNFKTFLKNARTRPVSWKGVIVAFYGAGFLLSCVVLVIELVFDGKFKVETVRAISLFTFISTMAAFRGGLWKEQTQTKAQRPV